MSCEDNILFWHRNWIIYSIHYSLKIYVMKTLIKSSLVIAAALFFQQANAQLALGATTSAAVKATVNATRATTAAINATHRVTLATANAVHATTVAATRASRASIRAARRIKNQTHANVNTGASVTNNTHAAANSNAGGEEKGLIRAKSVSEADLHASVNASLPMDEAKNDVKASGEAVKTRAEKTKAAAEKTQTNIKETAKSTSPEVKASGEIKATGSVKSGKK